MAEIIIGKLIIDNSDLNRLMVKAKRQQSIQKPSKKLKDTEGLSSANEEQLQSFIDNENELKDPEYAQTKRSQLTAPKWFRCCSPFEYQTQNDAIANTNDLINATGKLTFLRR